MIVCIAVCRYFYYYLNSHTHVDTTPYHHRLLSEIYYHYYFAFFVYIVTSIWQFCRRCFFRRIDSPSPRPNIQVRWPPVQSQNVHNTPSPPSNGPNVEFRKFTAHRLYCSIDSCASTNDYLTRAIVSNFMTCFIHCDRMLLLLLLSSI